MFSQKIRIIKSDIPDNAKAIGEELYFLYQKYPVIMRDMAFCKRLLAN